MKTQIVAMANQQDKDLHVPGVELRIDGNVIPLKNLVNATTVDGQAFLKRLLTIREVGRGSAPVGGLYIADDGEVIPLYDYFSEVKPIDDKVESSWTHRGFDSTGRSTKRQREPQRSEEKDLGPK